MNRKLLIPGITAIIGSGVLTTLLFMAAHVHKTHVYSVSVNELPHIAELVRGNSKLRCRYMEVHSPHSISVHVIGEAKDEEQLREAFPILNTTDRIPGADTFTPRIPPEILGDLNAKSLFVASDPFWLTGVQNSKGVNLPIRAAYSKGKKRFYLEYHWEQ